MLCTCVNKDAKQYATVYIEYTHAYYIPENCSKRTLLTQENNNVFPMYFALFASCTFLKGQNFLTSLYSCTYYFALWIMNLLSLWTKCFHDDTMCRVFRRLSSVYGTKIKSFEVIDLSWNNSLTSVYAFQLHFYKLFTDIQCLLFYLRVPFSIVALIHGKLRSLISTPINFLLGLLHSWILASTKVYICDFCFNVRK